MESPPEPSLHLCCAEAVCSQRAMMLNKGLETDSRQRKESDILESIRLKSF